MLTQIFSFKSERVRSLFFFVRSARTHTRGAEKGGVLTAEQPRVAELGPELPDSICISSRKVPQRPAWTTPRLSAQRQHIP